MACSCSKNKTLPAGMNRAIPVGRTQATPARTETNPSSTRIGPERPLRGQTQTFALDLMDGRTQTFGSRLEAVAEQVRHGGTIRPL